ncbi:FHA domain-containing protein [Melittangium boletus]|uniref:Pkn9 associate protein 1 n=1 Tax=Melittangium boletus DSM 14713 TaxID=1294270 RepID=A0A250I5R1_9BACT|nr:FHA domain-containing protein [Melittangium boletus]ATB27184.1 Pkn9 associate protein 1 [Melittangium boletus DSM 14713]
MSPPNPKRPPRSPRPTPGETTARSDDVELPFDDDEVAPLQADDPRPQRVPQFPVGSRRRGHRSGSGSSRENKDREMPPARFSSGEYEDSGHARAFLYVERGPGAGQLVPIQQGTLRLGRSSASDLRLQHPSISRRHAQLMRSGDRLILKDLGSQNGTYVNRVRLHTERELFSGDEIALGNALLRVRGPGPTPARPPIPYSRTPSSLRARMSGQRMMLLASATGALVAVFLMLPLMRVMRAMSPAPVGGVERAEAPSSPDITEAIEDVVPSTPARAAPPPEAAPRSQALAGMARAAAPRVKEGSVKPAARPSLGGADAARNPEEEVEILAHYEAGRIDAALALARTERREALAGLLSRFQEEWKAGTAALAAKDAPSAIPHLNTALALDQEIAKGWGVLAPRVRKALSQAQLQAEGK